MQSTWNDILRNPSPRESQGRNVFLNPDFLSTFWHCLQDIRPGGVRVWKGRSSFPGALQVPVGGLGPCSLQLPERRAQVWGQMPSSPRLTGAGGAGERLVLNSCSCQGVKKRKSEFRPQRKEKASGMGRVAGGHPPLPAKDQKRRVCVAGGWARAKSR